MKALLSLSLLFLTNAFTLNVDKQSATEEAAQEHDDGYSKLAEWMKSHGGRVDSRMAVGEVDGVRGIVTLENMAEDIELLHCPWKLVIGSSSLQEQMKTEQDMCDVVKIMASEYRLGEKSMGYPYLNHIELPRLGAIWEPEAVKELQGISPSQDLNRHNEWYSTNCGGGNIEDFDEATIQSLVSFISRASAVGMVPIYDLLNHHNGLKNAKLFLTEDGVHLRTVRPVQKGEQLFLSYGLKESSQMYRDYGFIEAWPRLWSWKDASTQDNHVFALFPEGVAAIHPSMDFLKQIWSAPSRSALEWQNAASQYTQTEVTPEALLRFTSAANALLEGLPTTLDEDEEILSKKEAQRSSLSAAADSTAEVLPLEDDIIAAIRYRIEFKRDVSTALHFTEQILKGESKIN